MISAKYKDLKCPRRLRQLRMHLEPGTIRNDKSANYNRWCVIPKNWDTESSKANWFAECGPKLNFQYPFQLKERIWRSDTLLDDEFLSLWVRLFVTEPPIQPLDNPKVHFRAVIKYGPICNLEVTALPSSLRSVGHLCWLGLQTNWKSEALC